MVNFAFSTHKGYLRKRQEDAYGYVNKEFFVVADGLGGLPAGEVAAKIAVETAQKVFRKEKVKQSVEVILTHIFKQANDAIEKEVSKDPKREGMSTTMVAVLIRQNKWWIANIGDSRGYLFCPNGTNFTGSLTQITDDHEDYYGVITRAVGREKEAVPDIFFGKATPGDIVLLTTDGLFEMVTDEEIKKILAGESNIQQKADKFVQVALKAGGKDNITTCLIKWE